MSLKFTKNGVLHCNTVRYNYKQARNMIADGCSGNISNCWSFNGDSQYTDVVPGYKSFRSFNIKPNGEDMLTQSLPTLDLSHTFYISFMFKSNALSNMAVRIKNASGVLFQHYIGENTNGKWVHKSMIMTESTGVQSQVLFSIAAYDTEIWLSRFIMVDLTDTFGAGNEPTKEWCDENIREHEVITNYGSYAHAVTCSNYNSMYYNINVGCAKFNYLSLDSRWEPREYMYMLTGEFDYEEGFLYSNEAFTLFNTNEYYAYIEYHRPYSYLEAIESIDFYFPEAEPALGSIPIVRNLNYNAGGGMWEWKRASVYNNRSTFSNGEYKLRIDFNNKKTNRELRLTAINLVNVQTNIDQYNAYNNTNVTKNDINKEWCDRWIDGRSSPIIHIKDPSNKSIKIAPAYKPVKRPDEYYYTRAMLNSYVGMQNDTWGTDNTDNSHLQVGDIAFMECHISDENNKKARFFVEVIAVTDTSVICNDLYYFDETQESYNIPLDIVCNDIEIRPELNEIKFDFETGTIYCSKLIKSQSY